jgi:hypothetical protein
MVMLSPLQPTLRSPFTTVARSFALQGSAKKHQSSPIALRAAFCITGDSEWLTGWPNSPTIAVVPLIIPFPLFNTPKQDCRADCSGTTPRLLVMSLPKMHEF